jgi:three-Cys-motif partner protein
MAARQNEEPALPLPGLYDLAKPKAKTAALGYHWKVGSEPPVLGNHSVAKHQIFDRYIETYVSTLTQDYRSSKLNVTIVDGFCGGGRYRYGTGEVDGSPMRMLHSIEEAQRKLVEVRVRGYEVNATFVFIDENANHVEFLRDLLVKRGYGDRIGKDIVLIRSTFEDAAPKVIAAIKNKGRAHRSLFFLDQYGWSAIKLATVRQIMTNLANPEVVMTFMVDNLVNLLSEKTSDLKALSAIDYTREDARALMDMKGQKGWKRIIQNTVYAHIQETTGAPFYTPFFIHPEESHRDYWLIHLAKHHQAREEMGKIHWDINNTFEHFGNAGLNALGFDPSVDMRQGMMDYTFDDDARSRSEKELLEQLPRLIHQATASGAPVTKKALFQTRCNDTPVIADILDNQLAALRDCGEIMILNPKNDARGSTSIRTRAKRYGWDDQIIYNRQTTIFPLVGVRAA